MKRFCQFFGIIAIGVILMAGLGGCNTLQSIEISREPIRTVYGQGQELDVSGLGVIAHYKKSSEDAPMASLQISGYDKGKPGEQTVTVAMQQQSAAFTVTVVPVEEVSLEQPPAATVFMQGDDFDPAGLIVRVEFENKAVPGETIGPERLTFSGYDREKAGVQTITAHYYDQGARFDVRAAALTGITVTAPPDNTEYFTGEDIDLTGLVVTGKWEDLGEKPVRITHENLSNFDRNRAGKQTVFVTYLGKTAGFPVSFAAMQSLSVSRPPAKLKYENGEELDLEGLAVQGTREGAASTEPVAVSRLKISGYDRFKGGTQTVTVTFGGKNAAFMVTVAPNPFEGTWHGTKRETYGQGMVTIPMTLVMSEDSWSLKFEETEQYAFSEEYRGTYRRDSDRGKHAELLLTSEANGRAPAAAEILFSGELKLTGGTFGQDGLPLIKR
jgi:hypothetical protein